MIGGEGRTDPDDPMSLDAAAAFTEYVGYVTSMVEERRAARRAGREVPSDVIATLVGADEDGVLESSDELTEDELTMFLVVLLVAGNEIYVERHRRRHVGVPGVSRPVGAATRASRALRHHGGRGGTLRQPGHQLRADGHPGHRGARAADRRRREAAPAYQSANRDEWAVFDRPDEFDVTRSPNPHIAFGVGPHVCMGINLGAVFEIRVLFEELIRRFPDMRTVPGFVPHYVEHALVHAIGSMEVRYTPEGD